MVPAVLDEANISTFKFWFDNQIQEGMSYQNELFYRLCTADVSARVYLYHYACRLSQSDRFVLTVNPTSCSLWISLRSADATMLQLKDFPLPTHWTPPSAAS